MMRFLKNSSFNRFEHSTTSSLSLIKEAQATVVGASYYDFTVLMIEDHGAQWRGWSQSLLWEVWII